MEARFVAGELVVAVHVVAEVGDDDEGDGDIREMGALARFRGGAHLVLEQGPKLRVVVDVEAKRELFLAVLSDHGEKSMVRIRLQGQGGSSWYLISGAPGHTQGSVMSLSCILAGSLTSSFGQTFHSGASQQSSVPGHRKGGTKHVTGSKTQIRTSKESQSLFFKRK